MQAAKKQVKEAPLKKKAPPPPKEVEESSEEDSDEDDEEEVSFRLAILCIINVFCISLNTLSLAK